MKWFIMNLVIMYVVACADDTGDNKRTVLERVGRVVLWPITVTEFFRLQTQQLYRLLNILWTVLIAGWFLSLMVDRL